MTCSWYGLEARKGREDCGTDDGSAKSCSIRFSDFLMQKLSGAFDGLVPAIALGNR